MNHIEITDEMLAGPKSLVYVQHRRRVERRGVRAGGVGLENSRALDIYYHHHRHTCC